MSSPPVILIAEDEAIQRLTLARLLTSLNFQVREAANGVEALRALRSDKHRAIALVILDVNMPEMNGLEALALIRQQYPGLPVIMLTGKDTVENAVQSMKLGAADFLTKPPEAERLKVAIEHALRMRSLEDEVLRLRRKEEGVTSFADIVGHDGGLREAAALGRKAAESDIPVLITGETGVGKELFARAIHGGSRRAGHAFVAINCGAIPEQLVESTLFGHEKGAFTGAASKTLGKFREAEGGTLFLDEIAELPPAAQVKLLRALQQKEVEPVGAGRPVPVNVRVIAATHRDLAAEVRNGRFREDLMFRLEVLPIHIPPLHLRRGDIAPLARYFLARFGALENKPLLTISPGAEKLLSRQPWPGNVRQLENFLHRAVVMTEGNELTDTGMEYLLQSAPLLRRSMHDGADGPALPLLDVDGRFKSLDTIEREAMQAALALHGNNIPRAAEALGMAKSTFYRKLSQRENGQRESRLLEYAPREDAAQDGGQIVDWKQEGGA